jgi:hypothetical protein
MSSYVFWISLAFLWASLIGAEAQKRHEDDGPMILYATNAIAIDECTLHILNVTTGEAIQTIGAVQDAQDDSLMGIFGMCFADNGVMYAINHLDQLVTLNLQTAKATIVGPVGVNGLYDLACAPSTSLDMDELPRLYSFGAQDRLQDCCH